MTPGWLRFARPWLGWLALAAFAGGGALLALLWGRWLNHSELEARLSRANAGNLVALERALDEFGRLRGEMRARRALGCSDANLEYFRRYLFTLDRLRDIGLMTGDVLVCTTALGIVEDPQPDDPPDLVLDNGIAVYAYWPVLISARRPTMILKVEGFNALVDPGLIASLTASESVARTWIRAAPDAPAHALFAPRGAPGSGLREQACSSRYGFCLEAEAGPVVPGNTPRLVGFGVLGAGSGLSLFLVGQLLIWRARNPGYRLRRAIRRGDLQAVYQPVVDIADGRLIGFELLARWPDAPDSLGSAEKFVAEAEFQGVISALTESMIRRAAAELGEILRADPDLRLAINVTAQELVDDRLRRMLEQCFEANGIARRQLVLELTERSVASPHRERLNELARAGYRIYIDDLGEGYSSLSYLHDLDIAGVKISRSFTSGLGTDSPKVELVAAMVRLALRLGLDVVLEGIETESAHAAAVELGGVQAQGFRYGCPMTIARLHEWIAQHAAGAGRLGGRLRA